MNEELRDAFNRIAPGWYNYRHWTIFRMELEGLAQEWGQGKLLNAGLRPRRGFFAFCQNLRSLRDGLFGGNAPSGAQVRGQV
jgi:hypothetical protein